MEHVISGRPCAASDTQLRTGDRSCGLHTSGTTTVLLCGRTWPALLAARTLPLLRVRHCARSPPLPHCSASASATASACSPPSRPLSVCDANSTFPRAPSAHQACQRARQLRQTLPPPSSPNEWGQTRRPSQPASQQARPLRSVRWRNMMID